MLEPILQRFVSGQVQDLPHEQATNHVSTMMQQAQQEHVLGALSDALRGMDSQTFGNSVASAAQSLNQEQRGQLGTWLLHAQGSGGGATGSALRNLGISSIDPGRFSAADLGTLAGHLHQHNQDGLVGLLGAVLGGGNLGSGSMGGLGATGGGFSTGSGSGMLALLGGPVVQQIGAQLAQRMLSGGRSSL